MCSAILTVEKYLVFAGLLLSTIAALCLVIRISMLFEWIVRARARWTFSALKERVDYTEKLLRRTTVPDMLQGSTIVRENMKAARSSGMWPMRFPTRVAIAMHDLLREELNLPPRQLLTAVDVLGRQRVEISHAEVQGAIPAYLATSHLSESRWLKFGAAVFFIGSALQLVANLPWC